MDTSPLINSKLILTFLLLFLTGATIYEPLKDRSYSHASKTLSVQNYDVEYESYIDNNSFSHEWLLYSFSNTSERLFSFANARGYSLKECRPVTKLDVFGESMDTLNDRERFARFDRSETDMIIWGLFDKRLLEKTRASIILTDHGSYNSTLYAHEISHYWAYRFCWDHLYPSKDGEDIAADFEIFYNGG